MVNEILKNKNKLSVDVIFDYFKTNNEYIDLEDTIISGKSTEDEQKLQEVFEEFVFTMISICSKERLYYYDEEEYFENYTMYFTYSGIQINVFLMYGQGNFFHIYRDDLKYKKELEVDLNFLKA